MLYRHSIERRHKAVLLSKQLNSSTVGQGRTTTVARVAEFKIFASLWIGQPMTMLHRFAALWRNILHKNQVERDLSDEVESYLESLIEVRIKSGLSPEEARQAAAIEIGGLERTKEKVRDIRMGHS